VINSIPSTAHDNEKPFLPTSNGEWFYVDGSGPENYTTSDSITKDMVVPNPPLVADAGGPYYGYTMRDVGFAGLAIGGEPPYNFSWDLDNDGMYDNAYGEVVFHIYDVPGVYTISLQVRDNNLQNSFNTTQVTVRQYNIQPNTPSTPSGPSKGKTGVEYSYTTSTTDPEGDQVYYWWDWGDGNNSGWLGPYDSGVVISATHTWNVKSSYSIRVQAEDTYWQMSDWATLPVTIPCTYTILFRPFWESFFERFPNALPVLR
jgi:PKD repeat protein